MAIIDGGLKTVGGMFGVSCPHCSTIGRPAFGRHYFSATSLRWWLRVEIFHTLALNAR